MRSKDAKASISKVAKEVRETDSLWRW